MILKRQVLFIFLVCIFVILQSNSAKNDLPRAPPNIFWKFGNDLKFQDVNENKNNSEHQSPPGFWDLYQDISQTSVDFGSYSRQSPAAWKNHFDSSPIRSVVKLNKNDSLEIMSLASRPRQE